MPRCAACAAASPPDARFCPACGTALETPTEERKLATVLFADLVGSTALGSGADPERTRAVLERFYDAMAEEVEAAGGVLEKFVGDAVQAAFGAPAAQEDHAERALHAALSMQQRLQELFGDTLGMRIGVNSGEVVVGSAWAGGSWLTGDAVNVAKRLEEAAAPGTVLVGERTAAAAGAAFEFAAPELVAAKGKSEPVSARTLVRALSLMRPRGPEGLPHAFVGRETELELLLATYHRVARDRCPHLVTIVGDAGVGKTRLMRELWDRLSAEEPVPLRRTGRCLPYGRGVTYFALGEVLKEHLRILESDPPDAVTTKLGEHAVLGPTLGLEVGAELHPLAAREQLHEAWVAFLADLAAERPTVLLLEDLHWAEESLLELLERVVKEMRGPLLVLGTARPELVERTEARMGRNATTLWLEPLSPEDSGRLIAMLAADLPESARDAVVTRAEGNPFFVEEIVTSLAEGGTEATELPDSVQAVLAARIDLLPALEKSALQAASVIGRVFWAGPVHELIGGEEPNFDVLEHRDFVRRRTSSSVAGAREYVIKHALTREVAYASIPKARRARLHAGFARWIERSGEGRDEHAALLAHHFAEAVRPEDADLAWSEEQSEYGELRGKAMTWLRRAAELATGRYEIDDAIDLLHRAVELADDDATRAALWREIGRANALKFDGPAFWEAMQESLRVCHDRPTCAETYSVLAFQTAIRSGMWKRRPESELVEGWIEQALELAEPETATHVRALIARSYWMLEGDPENARQASMLAERLDDPELRSYAWMARAVAAFRLGRYDEALTWAQRRFDLLGEITDPDHIVEWLETAVPTTLALTRFREARRLAREHAERSQRLTPHHRVHGVSLIVETDEAAGAWENLLALTPEVVEAVEANLETPCVRNARSLLVCAIAHTVAGDDDEAERLESAANEMDREPTTLTSPRLRLALLRGDFAEVERLLVDRRPPGNFTFGLCTTAARLDALAAVRDRECVEEEAARHTRVASYLQPFALRALGIVRSDRDLIDQSLEGFRALELDWFAGQTDALLSGAASR
jgi:class 3 adenylate cyclase/tetratricopeptide (TPR) repeat protein